MKYFAASFLFAAAVLTAQDPERITVPLSDPSRPATLNVELMNGDLTVRGYTGREVILDMKGGAPRRNRRGPSEVEGLKRIDIGGSGFEVEERDNVVRVNAGPRGANGDLNIQVPVNTSLKLKTMTGVVTVDGVHGELEANSMNGEVKVLNAEGSVIAHSLNGKVTVVMNRVEAKPMAFSTMNGDIDVTLPADTKARLRLKNDHGEVYSDFEMKLEATPRVDSGRREDGRYRVKFERSVVGTINGGGPEISFTTLNGQIRIRQKK